jgi:hypothetical protein
MNFYLEAAIKIKDDLDNCLGRFVDTYLKDKTIPLDERWEAFKTAAEMLPLEPYSDGDCETLLGSAAYDSGIERHQTMDYPTLYDWYLDRVNEKELYPEDEDEYNANLPSQQVADEWREQVLARGYGSFQNDW